MDGLENAEESSSESSDDDGDEAPSTSGMSCQAPKHGSDGVVLATEFPSGCQRPRVLSGDSGSPKELQQIPIIDPRNDTYEDQSAKLGETAIKEQAERKMVVETKETQVDKEAENKEPIEKEAAGAQLNEKEKIEMIDGERAAKVAPGQDRENIPSTKLEENQSGSTDICLGTVDLLSFHSVEELEFLGLDQLKSKLMTLGLKCGGTLQERAARLFSIRGLTREQIDPALFAKPLKGKKK